jgi:hypothetical protein
MLAFFFAFGISPKVLLKLGSIFRSRPDDDNDLAKLKANAEGHSFKLNENVPVEHSKRSMPPPSSATSKLGTKAYANRDSHKH